MIVVSYDPLYFCVVCCNIYFFISTFIESFFFLMRLVNDFQILFIFSKYHLLILLIFAMSPSFLFYVFLLLFSWFLSFYYLFCCCCSFCFTCFSSKVRLFNWWLSCFLMWACIDMNFKLSTTFTVSHNFCENVFLFSLVLR